MLILFAGCLGSLRDPASDSAQMSVDYENLEQAEEFDVSVEKRLNQSKNETGNPPELSVSPEDVRNTIALSWPVRGRITRGYDLVLRRPHMGLDIAAPRGTPIQASHDGIVIYSGNGFHGYGKLVMIEFGDRWATLYSHLSKINVREGQWVKRGQKIGVIGRTGNATGIHLHYEIRYHREAIDPLRYLPNGHMIVAYYR
ncbi:MAG: hypothetical protein A4S09_16310 [Proteobacteria bacterium SG_bin7]|nr:MAG: hypothetical protein A4S09_16310 [Proteobacteria bacterium SG_bin7]